MKHTLAEIASEISLREAAAWAMRAVLLIILLRATAHRPPYVIVGPPRTVETEHPITCVHTRL
ncbi:MAG TPA: hypothetical protein ENI95_05550, partial [Chloroflexi bacterium]|nr:hypothetical protein [Chloroflexota bacterium]